MSNLPFSNQHRTIAIIAVRITSALQFLDMSPGQPRHERMADRRDVLLCRTIFACASIIISTRCATMFADLQITVEGRSLRFKSFDLTNVHTLFKAVPIRTYQHQRDFSPTVRHREAATVLPLAMPRCPLQAHTLMRPFTKRSFNSCPNVARLQDGEEKVPSKALRDCDSDCDYLTVTAIYRLRRSPCSWCRILCLT